MHVDFILSNVRECSHLLDYEKVREKIHGDLLQRQAAEKGALDTVVLLLEQEVTEQQLIDAARKLNPQYYRDAVEERGLALRCGYPVCNQRLKPINHKQKYHISTKSNKVYDISERKYFCSSECYTASKYLEGQLSEEPLWARNSHYRTDIQLMKPSESQSVRDESVVIDTTSVYVDPKKDYTEELAEEILRKLTIDEDFVPTEEVVDPGGLDEDHSSDEELLPPAHDLLNSRKNQRLNVGKGSEESSEKSAVLLQHGDEWEGSMLNRIKSMESSGKPQQGCASLNDSFVLPHKQSTDKSKTKDLSRTDGTKVKLDIAKPLPAGNRRHTSKFSRERRLNHNAKYDDNLCDNTSGARTILLSNPLPAVDSASGYERAQKPKQTRCLEACFDRLLDWFTDESRKLLFTNMNGQAQKSTDIDADTQQSNHQVPNSSKSTNESSDVSNSASQNSFVGKSKSQPGVAEWGPVEPREREVELTTPNMESALSAQRGIVYRQILKSYEKVGNVIPESPVFKDRLSNVIKTFRLNRENVTARPVEWNVITLVLHACIYCSEETTVCRISEEVEKLTGEEQAVKNVKSFVDQQQQLV